MTVTSIGYGDISATCRNYYEMAWAASIMLLGGIMWSQAIFKIHNPVMGYVRGSGHGTVRHPATRPRHPLSRARGRCWRQ